MEKEVLKVSSKSNPNSVAGAIAGLIREQVDVELTAIGAGAINQAVKAIAIVRGFVATDGINLVCIPEFISVNIEESARTGMRFILKEEK